MVVSHSIFRFKQIHLNLAVYFINIVQINMRECNPKNEEKVEKLHKKNTQKLCRRSIYCTFVESDEILCGNLYVMYIGRSSQKFDCVFGEGVV